MRNHRDHFVTTADTRELRGRSVRSSAATLTTEGCRLVLGITTTAILARMLTPAEFGLIAMATAVVNFADRFKDLGLGMSTLRGQTTAHDQVSTLFWVNGGAGVLIALLTAATGPLIARFYDQPQLTGITVALAGVVVLGSLRIQHQALMQRNMRFAALGIVQVSSKVVGMSCAIAAAVWGAGFWSLVVLQLTMALASTTGVWLVSGWHPGKPVRGVGIRPMLAFGRDLTISRMLTYIICNLDDVLIGWHSGAFVLGLYNKAYQLLLLPVRQLNAPLSTVVISALSRLQHEPNRFRVYCYKSVQLLASAAMPVVLFMIVTAEEAVRLVLGSQWGEVVPIFRALGVAAFVGTLGGIPEWIFISLGRADRQLRWLMLKALITVGGFIVGLRWGAIGVATAFSITQLLLEPVGLAYCCRGGCVEVRGLASVLWRPVLASVAATFVLLLARLLVPSLCGSILALLVDAVVFAGAYALCWLALPQGRRILAEMLAILRDLGPNVGGLGP